MARKLARIVDSAAVYCRISLDAGGEALGVQRQQEMCEKLAAEKGWPVGEVYIDNDRSAYSGRPRPAYERMLADLEADRRDAVLCVDLDRLTRRPVELERFMEMADAHGIALANVSGDTDLSSSDGRFKARIIGAVARQESEKKAERVSRESEQAARRGIQPRGGSSGTGAREVGAVVVARRRSRAYRRAGLVTAAPGERRPRHRHRALSRTTPHGPRCRRSTARRGRAARRDRMRPHRRPARARPLLVAW